MEMVQVLVVFRGRHLELLKGRGQSLVDFLTNELNGAEKSTNGTSKLRAGGSQGPEASQNDDSES